MKKPELSGRKKILIGAVSVIIVLFLLSVFFVDRFIEPVLRKRLHTLIIQGSDSLYRYKLGRLKANFYGGNVEVRNLNITIDSSRYAYLRSRNALPSLTMELSLARGHIKGVGIIDLLFNRKISVSEIMTGDANIILTRHPHPNEKEEHHLPVWKAMRPDISSIYVDRIRLDGIKLSYKNADTSQAVVLQFNRCDALFENIRVDSSAAADSTRMGFTKAITMRFRELRYQTADSTYKMRAQDISYSSRERTLEVDSFKMEPTLTPRDFFEAANRQTSLYNVSFAHVRFVNTRLDHFIHNNIIEADSVVFDKPTLKIYNDKTLPPDFESKIGKYPHQHLLKAGETIMVKNISFTDGTIELKEKNAKTLQEGTIEFTGLKFSADNVTNAAKAIHKDPICRVSFSGKVLGSSPVQLNLKLYLDSSNGRFDASGWVKDVSAAEVNKVAVPLANVHINSWQMSELRFNVSGEDYSATANVWMRYRDLAITLRKTDEETGKTTTKKFLTKILNRFVIWPSNPGPDGVERISRNKRVARLTTQSFFGILWKTIFAGMQDVMMKSGRYQ